MSKQFSAIEQRILFVLQAGFPRSRTPYKDTAEQVGIDTTQLLEILERWKSEGKIRRLGAILNHFKAGVGAGAMVVWCVEPERAEQVGGILAGFKETTHVYERRQSEDWPYSLYTMVHGAGAEDVEQVVERMSQACGVREYRILATEKELKKVSPTYVRGTHNKEGKG